MARREILDAAAYYLHHEQFRDLSIGKLMTRTKIGRSAFYAYFKDLYAVVEVLTNGVRDQVLGFADVWGSGDLPREDAVKLFVTDTVNMWAEQGPMISAILDAASKNSRLQAAVEDVFDAYQAVIVAILLRDRDSARVRTTDLSEMAALLLLATVAYLKLRLGHNGPHEPEKVSVALQELWVHALYGDDQADFGAHQ